MTYEEKRDRIAELQRISADAQRDSDAACARKYEADAEIARLRDDPLDADFNDALAECYRVRRDGGDEAATERATARKDRAYIRSQASRCMDGDLTGIDPKDHAAVLAEVERLKAENGS